MVKETRGVGCCQRPRGVRHSEQKIAVAYESSDLLELDQDKEVDMGTAFVLIVRSAQLTCACACSFSLKRGEVDFRHIRGRKKESTQLNTHGKQNAQKQTLPR